MSIYNGVPGWNFDFSSGCNFGTRSLSFRVLQDTVTCAYCGQERQERHAPCRGCGNTRVESNELVTLTFCRVESHEEAI